MKERQKITIFDFVKRSYKPYFDMKFGIHVKFELNTMFAKPISKFFVVEQIVNLSLNLH